MLLKNTNRKGKYPKPKKAIQCWWFYFGYSMAALQWNH